MEVEVRNIADRLRAQEAACRAPRLTARLLRPRATGGSRPWDCLTEDGAWFVVKCQNNDQDRRTGPPLKVLSTELICGRLGRLFDPPLCPEPVVVDIPEDVAAAAWHPRTRHRPGMPAAPGPAFGSRRVEAAVEIKGDGAERLALAGPADVARIAVFQTWLRGVDVSMLVTADGRLLSVDHGYYLTNDRWDPSRLAGRLPVKLKLPSQLVATDRLADPAIFAGPLEELHALDEDRILSAFCGIPEAWGLPIELRAMIAACVLSRRPGVDAAVARHRQSARARRS